MNNTGNNDRLLDKALDLNVAYMFYAYNAAYMKTRFSKPLPRWARIGLGWYFMTAVIAPDGKVSLGRPAPRIAVAYNAFYDAVDLSSKWAYIPYADLIAGKPLTDRENDAEVLESWVMVSHLMSDKARSEKFFAYLKLVMDGTESMEAYNKTIGIDPESYRAILKQYMTKGVPTQVYEFKGLPDSATTISPLPYKEPVPLLDAGTRACPPDKHARTLLSRLQKVAPKYPDGVLAQQALARATIKAGNPEDAKTWLTAQVSREPEDFDSQLLLGQMYLAMAERGPADSRADSYVAARRALVKAYKLNPGSPPALYYYARSNADQPGYPNDNILKAAELAEDYSNGTYTVYLSDLLIRRGDYDRALKLIDEGLASLPSDKPKRKAAIQVIRDAVAARKPAAELTVMLSTFEREFEHKEE
ncbi:MULTISPECIES: hypothetical protein [Asticcacaulis]|uniref:tetratricopeptide repeat protein n=1 Tax=Asticcacaulis TaxID=76890 RepID=UPI001AE5181C|nr:MULTISPECIES: hypothetical protein [Asticcacaulis]MBP2160442.1 tetratricopeptide (TPR) repeat protein [Asticcacaulis solisilvae]MDR6801487.1 tetratricopeptide (TPR) repeat protein [Asticcacaulis sp. BE141]